MALIRLAVAVVVCLVLAGGYFAWHAAYFAGDTASYVAKVDRSALPGLSLLLLVAVVLLAFVPNPEEGAE